MAEPDKRARYGVELSVCFPEKRVRRTSDMALMASCTSEVAAWAAWRLLHVEWLLESMANGTSMFAGKAGDPRPVCTGDVQ